MSLKHKAHRKALAQAEIKATRKKKKTIEKWLDDWRESQRDFPVTKSRKKRKPLTKQQYFKWLKSL